MTRWNVTFAGNIFSLVTSAEANNEEEAIKLASTALMDYYGWDVAEVSHDIDAEKQE